MLPTTGRMRILLALCFALAGTVAEAKDFWRDSLCARGYYWLRNQAIDPHPDVPKLSIADWVAKPLHRRYARSNEAKAVAGLVATGKDFDLTYENGEKLGLVGKLWVKVVPPKPGDPNGKSRLEVSVPDLQLWDDEKGRPLQFQEVSHSGMNTSFAKFTSGLVEGIKGYLDAHPEIDEAEIVGTTIVNPQLATMLTKIGFVSRKTGKPMGERDIHRIATNSRRQILAGYPEPLIGWKNGFDSITLSLLLKR